MLKKCIFKWTGIAIIFGVPAYFLSHENTPHSTHRSIAQVDAQATTIPAIAGEVWNQDNEDQVDEIIQSSEKILNSQTGSSHLMRRDAHPKQHGCAKAFFDIDSKALPPQYRVGVFAPPADGSGSAHYLAWTRFSNGSPSSITNADLDKDVRGFAIKLMNVKDSESGSQDFLLSTSPGFFSKDGAEYASFNQAISRGNAYFLGWLGFHPIISYRVQKSRVQIPNVLQTYYYSTTPYHLGGDTSARFSTTPCTPTDEWDAVPVAANASSNYLRERLIDTLKKPAGDCFNFFVQPNLDPAHNPVENPTLVWNETTSPIYWVGKITFPGGQNDIDSPEQNALCENMSFSPWHTLSDTRPLGQINRIRRVVYARISEDRHEHNGVPVEEPRNHNPCIDGNLCRVVSP